MVRNNFSNLCIQDAGEMKIIDEKVLPGKPLSEFISEIKEVMKSVSGLGTTPILRKGRSARNKNFSYYYFFGDSFWVG